MRSTVQAMPGTTKSGRFDRLEAAMHTMQASEAKARLAELLRSVERGETVVITRHGKAIVPVIQALADARADRKQVVDCFRRHRDMWRPVAMSIDAILISRKAGHRL